jgi:outer membrane protein insertion porin family
LKRIADKSKPDGEDIDNLYQNNGYLFSNINAVEVKHQTTLLMK